MRHIHPAETKIQEAERFIETWPKSTLTLSWRAYILESCAQADEWIKAMREFAEKKPRTTVAGVMRERAYNLGLRVRHIRNWVNSH